MSDEWYWILILNLENAYTLNVGSQIQTKVYILICNYLVICLRIDCSHSRSWVAYFTGYSTTHPSGGGGRPGVGLSSMLSSRCWANVGPAGVAVWAVTGGWPGAVCELLFPFEHAKYQYLCKNYHYHYYYSWQSLVKAFDFLVLNSVLHWVRYVHSIALVTEKRATIYCMPFLKK